MATLSTSTSSLSLLTIITLLLLLLCSALQAAAAATTTNDLVSRTCSQTPDPKICESALRADPRTSAAKDEESLILIMIDSVKTRFTDALKYAQDLTRKTHDPEVIRALRECVRVYKVVLDANVVVATNAVKQGDPKFGEQAMVDSGNEAEACRSAFPDGKVPAGLPDRTRALHGVSNVAASLIKIME